MDRRTGVLMLINVTKQMNKRIFPHTSSTKCTSAIRSQSEMCVRVCVITSIFSFWMDIYIDEQRYD